ncbi:molybdopterin-dependent oxidoreductase [Haloplanus halobius]|uniref:molybdopterin-dependent oxidoreductase n=1 Tax=Haloplanus halobius TaxID=2934938 RepID=UPI00200E9FC3|nr:molybdopterin-dependent oxidoreductase [Haloplanus sp. XH21]
MVDFDPSAAPDSTRPTVTVVGAVSSPRSVRVTDLMAMRSVAVEDSTACDGEAPTSRWSGVPVGTILDRASPRSGAGHALVRSADPEFACGFALDRLRDALLAVCVDGDPIPADRGGPVRLIPPDADCWERVKRVSRIDVLEHPPGDADTARELALGE